MLSHPESWDWLDDETRTKARRRLKAHERMSAATPARKTPRVFTGQRIRADWLAYQLNRPQRNFEPPQPSTGWQAESELIGKAQDRRTRRFASRERRQKVFAVLVFAVFAYLLYTV